MPPEPTAARLKRLLVLVPWVIARPGVTVEEVCARFALTHDELAADLDLLFVCGLPPFGPGDLIVASMEGDRVVIEMADHLKRPPRLTRSEAMALLVMGRAVAALPGLEEAEALRSALGKLSSAVAPAEAARARDIVERVEVELVSAGADLLAGLGDAVIRCARLHLVYFSAGRGEMSERDVDPWLVFNALGNWYLVAFDRESGEERVFRVDRIKEWSHTGETFEPPSAFDASRHFGIPQITPSANDVDVTIDVSPAAAWVVEVTPHDETTAIADGWTRVRLRTRHLAWLVRLLLSAGAAARAVSPPELVATVRRTAERALALYGD